MFGPGAIATILHGFFGEALRIRSFVRCSHLRGHRRDDVCYYLCLAYAKDVLSRIGPRGIDGHRIVGFFVSTMGMGLIFHGVVEPFKPMAQWAAREHGFFRHDHTRILESFLRAQNQDRGRE